MVATGLAKNLELDKLKSNLVNVQTMEARKKPLLVFDGECGFCNQLALEWHQKTGELIEFAPYNEIADNIQQISIEEFKNEIKLIYPEGRVYGGAAAAFKVIEHSKSPLRALRWFYNHTRAFDPIWEWVYKIVARNRDK